MVCAYRLSRLTDLQLELESAVKGLRAIHSLNIRHLDTTPANLIIPNTKPDTAVWIDPNAVHRLVGDKYDNGKKCSWEDSTQHDLGWLWTLVRSHFEKCACYVRAMALLADIPLPPPAGPAPSVEFTEPRPPFKSLWEAEDEWESSEKKKPDYIAEIRNPSQS